MKIFELAKEYEIGALDLVEKLKSEGFSVRNHMTALTDEEVAKVRELLAPSDQTAKKKTKAKKTTKKKTTKKKVVKKTAKKTVVKKAKSDESEATPSDNQDVGAEEQLASATAVEQDMAPSEASTSTGSDSLDTATETFSDSDSDSTGDEAGKKVVRRKKNVIKKKASDSQSSSGLRVVSRPEEKKSFTQEAETPQEQEATTDKKKELFKEKVHTFTPVYIPDEDEVAQIKAKNAAKTQSSDELGTDSADVDGDDDDKKKSDKKRLGGLATMMSGKKAPISKAQALQQTRADTELKSYAALSSLGRPIYTQVKRKRTYSGPSKDTVITEVKDSKRVLHLEGGSTIANLAHQLSAKVEELTDRALEINLLLSPEDYVGIKLASKIAELYDYRVENKAFDEDKVLGKIELTQKAIDSLPLRDPIITIMGHVDHGKTTLLDYIRKAQVADGEAGGITQHIGAYSVKAKGKTLTFLDTPGHAAFASMRQRGADVTDVVVLVVAADDGVMPQTRESIKFCQNANKPIIVAVNKMDKEEANPDRVKSELSEMNITPEDWGGDVQFVPISALKGDGVDDLLDSIALQAEMMELRADPKGQAEGVVIESKIEQGRGPVATILVQTGTLKKGDSIVVGETFGRARSLTDNKGSQLKAAGPSIPVQILGLKDAPSPGDLMNVVKTEREAKKIAENRRDERIAIESAPAKKQVSLEDFFADAVSGEQQTLNLIIRSDVQGSFEAIKQALEPLGTSEVAVKIIGGGVGPISDSDVQLADSSSGIIIGFNMRPVTSARRLAEQKGIDVKTYSIIYELINDVKLALEGMLEPEFIEKYIGRAEVKETFSVPKAGVIAGSQVIDGAIKVGCSIRLLRDGKIMFDGKLSSLRRFKDDVKEVKSGYECGIGLQNFNDLKIGDIFEAYLMEEQKRKLEDVQIAEANEANSASSESTL